MERADKLIFFPIISYFPPHHNNWNNDRAFRSTDDFSVFTDFYFWGGNTHTIKKQNKTPQP